MKSPEARVREACEAARITPAELSAWARVDTERLVQATVGCGELSVQELDRCARVFGLRLDDLLEGEAGSAPMTLLLRDDSDAALDLRAVLSTEVHDALGEFQRVVREHEELERALGLRRSSLPRCSPMALPSGVHPGDHRARRFRDALGLGDEPIRSVCELVERCGVVVIWVTTDQVDRCVDGACVLSPRPAILANLLEGANGYPWRVRTTLAHELGHLVFDLESAGRRVLVSPTGRRSAALDEIERNARAFAACLLAPTEGVRALVARIDPSSEAAIVKVGSTYGVGRTVAINRLQHVFGLSDAQRSQMELRAATNYQGNFSDDQPPLHLGFRGEPLRGLVERALESGAISAGRARSILGIGPMEWLPFPRLGDAICGPSLTLEAHVQREAMRYLAERAPSLTAGPPELVRERGAWRVPVLVGGLGDPCPGLRGYLWMTAAGAVIDSELELGSPL